MSTRYYLMVLPAENTTESKEELFRQSNEVSKTLAKSTRRLGRLEKISKNITRSVITQRAGILLQVLIKNVQKSNSSTLEIPNLDALAREAGSTSNRVKEDLILLGGYTYQLGYTRKSNNETFVGFQTGSFITLTVEYKYGNGKTKDDYIDLRQGTGSAYFIKGKTPYRIKVQLNALIFTDLINTKRGKSFGFHYLTDKTIPLDNDLSQSAYKLRLFIAANTLNHGIGFLKLRQRLGYTHKDDFDRGIPRIRREIESAFEELQKAEVISSYSRNAAKDIYTWELTTKYILRTKTKLMGTTNRRMGTTNREKGTTNRKAPSILPTNGE